MPAKVGHDIEKTEIKTGIFGHFRKSPCNIKPTTVDYGTDFRQERSNRRAIKIASSSVSSYK
jgi:hypothetical protein